MKTSRNAIQLRLIRSPQERLEVFALRYRAYRSIGAIQANPHREFSDTFDRRPGGFIFGLRINGQMVASLRILLSDALLSDSRSGYGNLTANRAFGDVLEQEYGEQGRLIEANRFVVDPSIGRLRLNQLLCLFRSLGIVCLHFGARAYIGAVRDNHAKFYRRLLHMRALSDDRLYPGLLLSMRLMGADFETNYSAVCRRWGETFQLTPREREKWGSRLTEAAGVPEGATGR